MVSLLGFKIWEYFTVLFDTLPKYLYFFYAAVASALDALQCLMRRLAGLDVYYVGGSQGEDLLSGWTTGQTAVVGKDPASEFILGILGIGDNAAAYSGLQTVFWSLTIFGVIVLALSTIVAIVKSHYQEDAKKTDPVAHLYTALKAIFTFAIVPILVIFGFGLSNFLLRTLDNIVAGTATEESLDGVYGDRYRNVFVPANSEVDRGKEYYARYDVFSFGMAATTTPFSGLIFRTCAYNANRIRTGSYDYSAGTTSFTGNDMAYYNFDLFGEQASFPETVTSISDPTERRAAEKEWTAYQIDYAFANNLKLKNDVWAEMLYGVTPGGIFIGNVDNFAIYSGVGSFSKYNVGLVWYYYNLWQFNFVIGFTAICVCFTLFVNIIFGLISRIIKSAALFLIYPAILGLNPLDGGEAFKKWRQEFMPQVLMTFGAIIGMNLLFLLFPYVENIKFFGFWPLDGMVSILVITAGLVMIKEFIKFISALVGGADANEIGKQVRQDSMDALKKGVSLATAPLQVASMFVPGMAGLKAASTAIKGRQAAKAFNAAGKAAGLAKSKGKKLAGKAADAVEAANTKRAEIEADNTGLSEDEVRDDLQKKYENVAIDKYKMTEDTEERRSFIRDNVEKNLAAELDRRKQAKQAKIDEQSKIIESGGKSELTDSERAELAQYEAEEAQYTERQKKIAQEWGFGMDPKKNTQKVDITEGKGRNKKVIEKDVEAIQVDKEGRRVAVSRKSEQEMVGEFNNLGPKLAKAIETTFTQALDLSGLQSLIGTAFRAFDTKKYDSEGKEVGEYKQVEGIGKTLRAFRDSFLGVGGKNEEKKSESEKLSASADSMSSTADKLGQAAEKILKAAEKLERAGGRH